MILVVVCLMTDFSLNKPSLKMMFVGRFKCFKCECNQLLLNVLIESDADVSQVNLIVGYGIWTQVALVDWTTFECRQATTRKSHGSNKIW